MYGKIFASMFTGSMMGAGSHVHAVMTYAVSNADAQGYVELNPALLAVLIGDPQERIEQAIAYLTAPDPDSRTPDEEGRRIVREGQFLFRIVNYCRYRAMYDRDAKREQTRQRVEKHRELKKRTVTHGNAMKRQVEAEAEVNEEKKNPAAQGKKKADEPSAREDLDLDGPDAAGSTSPSSKLVEPDRSSLDEPRRASRKRFVPPTLVQVQEYIGANPELANVDAAAFVRFFEDGDPPWTDSRGKAVRNWKQKLRTWSSHNGRGAPARQSFDRNYEHRRSSFGDVVAV